MSTEAAATANIPERAEGVSASALSAAIYLGAAAVGVVSLMPMLVGILARDVGLGAERAGYVMAADRTGALLGTAIGVLLMRTRAWRPVVLAGVLGLVVGNLVTGFFGTFVSLAICRFLIGVAQGTVSAACYRTMGSSARPERGFAFYCALQMIMASLGTLMVPWLVRVGGWQAPFVALAILALPGLGAAALLPARPPVSSTARQAGHEPRSWAPWVTLASIVTFFVGMGGLFAYMERIGDAQGLAPTVIARSLSIASLAGLGGALLVGVVAHRLGRGSGAALGALLAMASIAAFLLPPTPAVYVVAASVFNFAWDFFYPFQFALLSAADRAGTATALTPAATGSGLALGPALAATLLTENSLRSIPVLALSWCSLSLLLLLAARRAARRVSGQ